MADQSAIDRLDAAIFAATGVKGMGAWAYNLKVNGASEDEIVRSLRYGLDQTPEGQAAYQSYLQSFPGMDKFLTDGVFTGVAPEQQYSEYRKSIREAATRFGIDSALTTNDKIASYIAGGNSAAEIVQRMNMAAAAAATTPPETMAVLRDYYGVQNGDLVSFYLDPDTTEALLQQRYTAARIGTEAVRQNVGVNQQYAENLAQRGFSESEAAKGFSQVAAQQSFQGGAGETATQEEIMAAAFGDQAAQQKIERVSGSRIGRFQEGGGFAQGQTGVGGLGVATT